MGGVRQAAIFHRATQVLQGAPTTVRCGQAPGILGQYDKILKAGGHWVQVLGQGRTGRCEGQQRRQRSRRSLVSICS